MNTHLPSTTEGFIAQPAFTKAQVDYLKQVFPNQLPRNPDINERGLGALFGEQRVIDHIAALVQQQEEEAFTSNVYR